jgi:hypothetical protein
MKSKVDSAFWRRFNGLPSPVQELARKYHGLWLADPFYPLLHFKGFRGNIWSVRIGDHYRATGYFLSSDTFVWTWIGTHEEYNKF